ncbi:hypothetical protein HHI36_012958 [Cryptolaemus montrouzieri]|uniref:Uncharacterized protein n=1 Tax=Cryptolaemus montrouzieri TaxID=559131 RepID=A0ABD2NGD8_9CUCU
MNSEILSLFDVHAPYRAVTVRGARPPYITYNITQISKAKNDAYKIYLKSRSARHLDFYRQIRNYLVQAIRREKKAYINQQVNLNKNPKSQWKTLSKVNIHKNKKDNQIIPDIVSAENLNDFFLESLPC